MDGGKVATCLLNPLDGDLLWIPSANYNHIRLYCWGTSTLTKRPYRRFILLVAGSRGEDNAVLEAFPKALK